MYALTINLTKSKRRFEAKFKMSPFIAIYSIVWVPATKIIIIIIIIKKKKKKKIQKKKKKKRTITVGNAALKPSFLAFVL